MSPPTLALELDSGRVTATWRSESEGPPAQVCRIDDRCTVEKALRLLEGPGALLYTGDFHNARQLLSALDRRVPYPPVPKGASPLELFQAERAHRHAQQALLGRLVVALDEGYRLPLRRAPDVAEACEQVWGPPAGWTVVPLRTLVGMMGAAEWRRKGLAVPGLKGLLFPHYGVFTPTRHEYLGLLLAAPPPAGKVVFDVGTGTGVLSFILLQRGAARVTATDVEPRAVACAEDNARRLGLSRRMTVLERPLFPEGEADLVVCNPPWVPETPRTRIDRAVFDPESSVLTGFLSGLTEHLSQDGEAYLLLSDFPELLGLRPRGFLPEAFARAGLTLKWKRSTPPLHPKAHGGKDPLHALRAKEVTSLYCLKRG